MDNYATQSARSEHGWSASDFIPESHHSLPMLRIFLPLVNERGNFVRWSRFVPFDEATASLDWFELADRVAIEEPGVRDLVSCRGELDDATVGALRDAVGNVVLHSLHWVGYASGRQSCSTCRMLGEDYFEAPLEATDIHAGVRVPEFVWDDEYRLAWGGRLYPDSLVVAAELNIFQRLIADPRLDTISVVVDRDVLPPSSGD